MSTNVCLAATSNRETRGEWVMDAKYNHIIDSMKWRIALNMAGFTLWLVTALALLKVAVR